MKTFQDAWQSMPPGKKQHWADTASTTQNCMKATASQIRKGVRMPGKHWREAVSRAYIEIGEAESKKLHDVEAALFPSVDEAAA